MGGGEGGGIGGGKGEGDGVGGFDDGDGELASQQVFLHFLSCFAFVHLLTFLHFFSFVVSVRPLQSFGCEGGGGDGGGGDGGSGGGSTQQAFLQFLESASFPFALHRFIHFFSISSTPHDFVTCHRSFFLHFVSSATQFFSDGAAAVLFVSSADSSAGGVTAPTQFSTHNAASILAGRVPLILGRVAFFI